jgi:hypothetical protein
LWGWRCGFGAWCAGGLMAAGGRGTRDSSGGRPKPATGTRSRPTRPCTKRRRAGATRPADASCAVMRSRRSPSPSADTCACVRAAASTPWQRRTRGVLCATPPSPRRPSASSGHSLCVGQRNVSASTGCRSDPAAVPRMTHDVRPRSACIARWVRFGEKHYASCGSRCGPCRRRGGAVSALPAHLESGWCKRSCFRHVRAQPRSREQPRHGDHVRYASDTEGIRGWGGGAASLSDGVDKPRWRTAVSYGRV